MVIKRIRIPKKATTNPKKRGKLIKGGETLFEIMTKLFATVKKDVETQFEKTVEVVETFVEEEYNAIKAEYKNLKQQYTDLSTQIQEGIDEPTQLILAQYEELMKMIHEYFTNTKELDDNEKQTPVKSNVLKLARSFSQSSETSQDSKPGSRFCRIGAFTAKQIEKHKFESNTGTTGVPPPPPAAAKADPSTALNAFNVQYLKILKTVNEAIDNAQLSGNFKDLIELIKKLPYYKDSLEFLTKDNSNETHTLKVSYLKILIVLKARCMGALTGSICGMAARIAGPAINDLYKELIADAKRLSINLPDITSGVHPDISKINELAKSISDEVLTSFVHKIIPILEAKLTDTGAFNDELKEIEDNIKPIISELCSPETTANGGGARKRKSSKHAHALKEILGKHMKIYKMPNDKKEYVKHKGVLITVKQYKGLMKIKADTKKVVNKKIILGKERCVYKVPGSKKEHIKYKGTLVTVTDYIKLMKKHM